MQGYIEPGVASGFRDYLPEDAIPRQRMFDTIREVFERFGFSPLVTPAMERIEVLTGNDPDFNMQIFKISTGGDQTNPLALRFDHTVPLARVVAQYQTEIDKPFKRYAVGPVWRGEKAQAGRYREFAQFDADTVGTADVIADAEVIALMYETMTALGIKNFLIRVNNRKVLNGLPEYVGFDPEKIKQVLRILDKLDKASWDGVAEELERELGFEGAQLDALKKFVDLKTDSNTTTVKAVKELMSISEIALEGARELEEIISSVTSLGVPDSAWSVDLSVARGLDYYTGPVFETILTDLPEIGSVFSGGRYDGLVARFGSTSVPATGASVGVDRLFAALEKLGLVKRKRTVAEVIIFDFDPEGREIVQSVATDLRRGGISTEIYFGNDNTLKGQLAYAVRKEFPIAIIIGSNERERGEVTVKNLVEREQVTVPRANVVETVKEMLR